MSDAAGRQTVPGDEVAPSAGETADATAASALADWIDRLAAGDLAARDHIIERCANRLRVLTRRMLSEFPNVRRWDDTDDVFQNAALRLYRTLGKVPITEPREVMALAATELHRELIDLARKHAGPMSFAANHATNLPRQEGSPLPLAVCEAVEAEARLDRWERFQEAIATLPDELREVFRLVWYLDADQQTIARLLGCTDRTVRRRWTAARQAIRDALDGMAPA